MCRVVQEMWMYKIKLQKLFNIMQSHTIPMIGHRSTPSEREIGYLTTLTQNNLLDHEMTCYTNESLKMVQRHTIFLYIHKL